MVWHLRFSLIPLITSILEVFGVLWLVVSIATFFFEGMEWIGYLKDVWWLFGITGAAIGLARAWPRVSVEARVAGSDVFVAVRIGNLFRQDGAIVVGSNTTFDTSTEDGTISEDSIQGQFTDQFCDSVSDLDGKLDMALRQVPVAKTRDRSHNPYGKLTEYEMGTVAPINTRLRKAYFVAIANLNSEGVASGETDKFLDALPKIWNGIRVRGGMEHLACPVLGSGFTRLTLTRTQLIQSIIRSFVAATREGKLSERLTIVVNSKDVKKAGISLEEIERFLEHVCTHSSSDTRGSCGNVVGHPV